MIEIEGLQFRYRQSAFCLQVPRLSVASGECAAVIGPSGCGKTTLLRMIAGIQVPDTGRVSVAGQQVSALSDAARRQFRVATIGFVFQDFGLLPYLTVRDNVLLPYLVHRGMTLDAAAKTRAERLCEELGLGEKLRRKPDTLSQGEKQRVAICRALVNEPRVILADEPTGNLDPSTKRQAIDLLLRRSREAGATLLVVTHDHSLLDGFPQVIDAAEFAGAVAP